MILTETTIPGCFEIQPKIFNDDRGSFVKVFHEPVFKQYNLVTDFKEEYYSVSKKNVLRGLHFQLPSDEHEKLVYCTQGEVLDVVVDLREGSPSYAKYFTLSLSAVKGNIIYIPKGLAHGFFVLSDSATMTYKVTTVHSPKNDVGILWSSIGLVWPNDKPIISTRDQSFATLAEFDTPFEYRA